MTGLKTIFLIDDDAIQLKIASKMIERAGPVRKIIPFMEAKSALDFLQKHATETALLPDIILLDLNMPEMTGWDFLEIFEKNYAVLPKRIRVHILSSSQDEKDIARAGDHVSVSSYLVKPLTREKIHSLLND